jgi:hypothetical protein
VRPGEHRHGGGPRDDETAGEIDLDEAAEIFRRHVADRLAMRCLRRHERNADLQLFQAEIGLEVGRGLLLGPDRGRWIGHCRLERAHGRLDEAAYNVRVVLDRIVVVVDLQPDCIYAKGRVVEIEERYARARQGDPVVVETGQPRLDPLLGDRHVLAGALDAQDAHLVAVDAMTG